MTVEQRSEFAIRVNSTTGHLANVAYGVKPCAASLAVSIDRESKGSVRCETLCPEVDWPYLRRRSRDQTKRKVV